MSTAEKTKTEMKLDCLQEEAKKLKLYQKGKIPDEIQPLVLALTSFYEARHSDLMDCEACGMPSPDGYPACPGCGEIFIADAAPVIPIREEVEKPTKAEKPAKVEKPAKAPKAPKEPKAEKPAKEEKAPKEPKAPKAEKSSKEPKAEKPDTAKPDTAKVEEKQRARLVELEKKIEHYRTDTALLQWDLGVALGEIRDNDLWRASGEYKSYGEYVEKRHDFSRRFALELINVSRRFSREEAKGLKVTQLIRVANAPEEDREEMLEQARNGATTRELAETATARRAEKGLRSERLGLEGTVMLTARLRPGKIAEGQWEKNNDVRSAQFVLGEAVLVIRDLGETFELVLQKQ